MKPATNGTCKEHSGCLERISHTEDSVKKLWEKWDKMNVMVMGIFITLSANLIAVIMLLVRTVHK